MGREENKFIGDIKDFIKDLVVILVIVFFIRFFLAMPFQISWQSMYSSYYDREFIIVDRLSYRIWKPKRWDVIVFKPHVSDTKRFFLKRIIAISWDELKINNWKVFLPYQNENILQCETTEIIPQIQEHVLVIVIW